MQNSKPQLLMVVLNEIVRDGRVLKSAAAAAAAGFEVTVLGRCPSTTSVNGRQESSVADMTIVRVPVPLVLTRRGPATSIQERFRLSRLIAYKTQDDFVYATHRRKRRERAWRTAAARQRSTGRSTSQRLRVQGYHSLIRADGALWDLRRRQMAKPPHQARWTNLLTNIDDFDYAFSAEIERLAPDLIHAHDFTAISIVGAAVERMRANGQRTTWLYDAHEYVPGIALPVQEMVNAYAQMERDWISSADAVITVGPLLSSAMHSELALSRPPDVVLNCPVETSAQPDSPVSIRSTVGLADDDRLIVYSGGITKARGVDTVVRALVHLPNHHFAMVVADPTSPVVCALLELADGIGVADRVHTAPFVKQHEITTYLASADIAVHTLTHFGNHEVALPNKLFEYIHAGVPVAVSDVKAMSEFVNEHGIGEVFVSEDEVSLASAITKVEASYDRYKDAVMQPELKAEHSWETQARTLVSVYSRMLDSEFPEPQGSDIVARLLELDECAAALDSFDVSEQGG